MKKKRRIPTLAEVRGRVKNVIWRVIIKPMLKGLAVLLFALIALFWMYHTHNATYTTSPMSQYLGGPDKYLTRTGEYVERVDESRLVERFSTNEAYHIHYFREWIGNNVCYWQTMVWGPTRECTVNTVWGVPR